MKKTSLQYVLLVLFTFSFSFYSTSQEQKNKKVPLKDFLQTIENKYDIKFSYVNEVVDGILISNPKTTYTLDGILAYVEKEISLSFQKIDEKYYAISKRKGYYICGKILDKLTNKEILDASIKIYNLDKGTVSNEQGFFSFQNIKLNTKLRIRALGYKEVLITTKTLLKKPCSVIYLQPKNEMLDEVVVQQILTTGLTKKRNGSITINTEKFGILPGLIEPDILQTIQAIPGVESVNETVSNINIRGGTNDQNVLLWDNIKMYQSGHFFGLISAFNPYLNEKVSVVRNGTSASLGDGISSTIDMHSHNEIKNSPHAGAGVNFISADVFAHIPIDNRLGIQVSARRSMTDFLKTPTYNQYFKRVFQDSKITNVSNDTEREERFFFSDASCKLLYNLNKKHKIRANLIYMNNDLEYEEFSDLDTKTSTLEQKNAAFGGSLTSSWNSRFNTELQTYYTNYTLESENVTFFSDQKLIVNNEILETGVKFKSKYKINKNIDFINGYQFYEVGITNLEDVNNPSFSRKIKEVIRYNALFSEVEYQSSNNKTFIRFGGRANYIEKFSKFIVEPRVTIHQRLSKYVNLEFMSERKNQVANQVIDLQRDFLGVEKRKWILANNKDIPISQSQQISLGFNFNKKSFYAGIEGFYKRVEGITTSNQSFFNQNQFQRTTGSYDVKGLEFLINKKTSKYSTWLSYTASKNTYTFEAINPKKFPNNLDVRHSLSFAGTYNIQDLKVALGINWRTGKPYTKPLQGNEVTIQTSENKINYQQPNTSNLPSYFRVDFSSTYKFNLNNAIKASFGVAILNTLNRKNTLDIYYRLRDAKSTEVQQIKNISLGITPNISFRIFF